VSANYREDKYAKIARPPWQRNLMSPGAKARGFDICQRTKMRSNIRAVWHLYEVVPLIIA
jgi:hypothetical protein